MFLSISGQKLRLKWLHSDELQGWETVVSRVHGLAEAGANSPLVTVCAAASLKSQPPTEGLREFVNCVLNFVPPLLLAVP